MAVFYEDNDKHMIVLLKRVGWRSGVLYTLFGHPEEDKKRSKQFMPEVFRLMERVPSHRHGQVRTRTQNRPPKSTYTSTYSGATRILPRPSLPPPPCHQTTPSVKPYPPSSLLPFTYSIGWHRCPTALGSDGTARSKIKCKQVYR